ncbi:NADH dehydrogenase subunit L [Desulfuromonas versatilis]|uniref:NADH dehydrogenase subunit L n=1 Tax=Desulfuromonas versatilis TaxID=2802975 RepID=A0ABM8HTN6_9BACT|nr:NADH-quinone oxidoreductase subunit L [Desulfuromonas versatilis]BCR05685.1 NADH dehydrogenase subunit L [Desulfuromonas versatilis]
MNQLTLIPLLPLLGFLVNGLFGARLPRRLVALIACALPAAAFALSFGLFRWLADGGAPVEVTLFAWAALEGFQVDAALWFDPMAAVMCLLVTGVGTLIHLYSVAYMAEDESFARYFAYLNLFLFFMLLLVLGKNLLVLFAGWEGVGIASYLLIGFWFKDPEKTAAGIKAFVVNRVGDTAFILAAFLLFFHCGTLDFQGIAATFAAGAPTPGMTNLIALLLLIGACGKSAQLPLHVWLPDAMAGPTPVSALIHAATMVTAGVYLLARLSGVFLQAPEVMTLVAWGGAATALIGASMGLTQFNLKKVLAYSTMSQIGYMFMACGLGAFNVAFFHLTTHAFFKACLFLGAGSVIHALHGEEDMRRMGALARKIPLTFATFLVASLALCGVPPLAGFFSKDEILWNAWAAPGGSPALWLVGALTAGLTAFYMFRAIFLTFFGPCNLAEQQLKKIHEAPPAMAVVLVLLAGASLAAGLIGLPGLWRQWLGVSAPFYDFLAPVLGGAGEGALADHHLELLLMLVSVAVALGGILLAWLFFLRRPEWALRTRQRAGYAYTLVSRGYFFDALYQQVVVRCLDWFSEGLLARRVEIPLNESILNKPAGGVRGASRLFSRLQSGNVKAYVFYVFVGLALVLWWGVAHV